MRSGEAHSVETWASAPMIAEQYTAERFYVLRIFKVMAFAVDSKIRRVGIAVKLVLVVRRAKWVAGINP